MHKQTTKHISIAVFAAVLVLLFSCICVFAAGEQLVVSGAENVEINYEVDSGYAWEYDSSLSDSGHAAWRAGNSYTDTTNVSNLAITVTGAGQVSYDYKLSTPSNGRLYAYYYNMGSPVTADNYENVTNSEDFMSNRGKNEEWRTETITITSNDLDESGKATIYVAYCRNGTSTSNSNYVAISNVKYTGGLKMLTVAPYDTYSNGGTISVEVDGTGVTSPNNVYSTTAGSTITLTANPSEGYQFYGWLDKTSSSTVYKEASCTYTFRISQDTVLEARFAPKDTYIARRNATFYTGSNGLRTAINGANPGETVVMLRDAVLSNDATLKSGVTLLIPCMDGDSGYIGSGDSRFGPEGTAIQPNTGLQGEVYHTLTISSNATLTVNGTVLVNAVTGRPAAGHFDQGINGGYGKVVLDGNIVVNSGGMLENYGIIDGSGQVTAHSGSTVVDLYVVKHWRGGSHAAVMVFQDVYPMNEIDCHNIMTDVLIESGASFQGAVRMFASGSFHMTHFPQIDNSNGLIRLNSGAYVVKTFDKSSGISTLNFYGGATFSRSTLLIVSLALSTGSYIYPVDGDIAFNLMSGSYVVNENFKCMPGFKADLASDATLTVNDEKSLVLYDVFNDPPNTSTTQYPSGRAPADITVHGGALMTVNGTFAGRVVTGDDVTDSNYARLRTGANSVLSATTKEANGYHASEPTDGTLSYRELSFKAELWTQNGLNKDISEITGAKTWYGSDEGWTNTNPVKLPGDLDGNGTVNVTDLNNLLQNYNKTGSGLKGDIDNNGIVNVTDLNTLLQNYNKTLSN